MSSFTKTAFLGAIAGGMIAAVAKSIEGYALWIVCGAGLGLLLGPTLGALFRWWYRDGSNLDLIESVEIGGITFRLASPQRKVAWQLFIEVMSRVATQPLPRESGDDREAMDSLHALFSTTRTLLQEMPPTNTSSGVTVELFALEMLNRDLRPFLSKWHPLLSAWEAARGQATSETWSRQESFREALEEVRGKIAGRAKTFGQLGGVQGLEKYF